MTLSACAIALLLAAFSLRRYLHWFASLLPERPSAPDRTRSIAILVAARNEAHSLPRLLAALHRLEYPPSLLTFVLVSDASTDATPRILQDWAASHPRARSLHLPRRRGKGGALQAALSLAPPSALVAVLDADTVPAPDSLAWLSGAFDDPAIGAVSGYLAPANSTATVVSRYAALERWVFHLVTLAGKDRLGANPPAIGALCAFRREALEASGGFPAASAEDICLSMQLANHGWRSRWLRRAVAREDVPVTMPAFLQQRQRWSRGLIASSTSAGRLEDLFVAAGYLDRLVLAAACALSWFGAIPLWLPAAYLVAPVAATLTALWRARAANPAAFLAALVIMAFADLYITARSTLAHVGGKPLSWAARAPAPVRLVRRQRGA